MLYNVTKSKYSKNVYVYIYTWVVYEYVCMFLIIREYTHIQVMEMCILTYCMYVQYIYIYIQAYIYTCDIFIDHTSYSHTSISYVLYLYTHIYTWLCNIIYTNAYYWTCMSHPNNQPNRLTVDFWSHSGWAPRTWILSVSVAQISKRISQTSGVPNHRDCSLLPPLIYIRSLSFLIMHLQK